MNIIKALSEIGTNECFGYAPKSSSTKPAHVANGWFKRLLNSAYDPTLLNDTVVHWVGPEKANPSEQLLQDHAEVFGPFGATTKRQAFADFRADLKLVVSPYGGAVNRGNVRSSYNITNARHLTKDYSDNSIGEFLYYLTTLDCGSGISPIVDVIRKVLLDNSDEVSILTGPLLRSAPESAINVKTYPAASVFKQRKKQLRSAVLQSIRLGFDQLARFEQQCGGGIAGLQRAVAFGVLAVLLHMTNRRRELIGEQSFVPILLYFQGRRRTTVYHGSHHTYNMARREIEFLFIEQFRSRIVGRIGEAPTLKQCKDLIKTVEAKSAADSAVAQKEILGLFTANLNVDEPLSALAAAVTDVAFKRLTGRPIDFYRALGVRIGFIRPFGNSATKKFYTLDGILLEAALGTTVSGELSFRELLDLLWERYGFLTGGRPEDADILLGQGVGHVTVEDLKENAQHLREHLVSTGWGRPFADGVLVIRVPEGIVQ